MIKIKSLASGSSGNCYWVTDGSTPILLEAGIRFHDIRQGIGFRVSELGGVLISHEHGDHCKAAKDIIKAGVDIYTSPGTIKALGLTGHRIHPVQVPNRFDVGTWVGKALKAQHDAVEPINFLLWSRDTGEKLVYLTDTCYTRYTFPELNYIMVECNYSLDILNKNVKTGRIQSLQKDRIIKTHFGLENVKSFLAANDLSCVQEIWLLHLSDRNSSAELFKREIQELTGKIVYIAGQ